MNYNTPVELTAVISSKIKTIEELTITIDSEKRLGKKIVFTNGCFDILHSGHVLYLEEAKKYGDILVVGVNSDSSVKRLKGSQRPINSEQNRAIVLAALQSVDYVTIFSEDTPYQLISKLVPNILVKGGDWKEEEIVGSDIVKNNGGKIYSLNFYEGHSTTDIIDKIKDKG